MNYDMVKFERGQVWMIRSKIITWGKEKNNQVDHEQAKDRPWLILSIGKFNKSSGMVTAVPITTRDRAVTPSQVLFINERNVNNVIMCEQIKTFDCNSGKYIFDFMGNLSPEVLEKVDVALSIHLGLHYSPITLKKLYASMEAIIKSVEHLQDKDKSPVFTDDDVLDFATKLQDLAGVSQKTVDNSPHPKVEIIETPCEPMHVDALPLSPEDRTKLDKLAVSAPVDAKKVTDNSTSTRIKWTKEMCEEFLHDADTLPMKEVCKKWNILKKPRFYSMKHYAQNLLTKEV